MREMTAEKNIKTQVKTMLKVINSSVIIIIAPAARTTTSVVVDREIRTDIYTGCSIIMKPPELQRGSYAITNKARS